ncbi:MAG TPA: response regulator [Azospirillum sp.]|nr:response regulator [Azospirillum sp.]
MHPVNTVSEEPQGFVSAHLSPASILVVDDDPRNLLAMQQVLGDLGATVVLARSGEEALKYVLDKDFAAILLDVRMPAMDGYETAELIRKREKSRHIPIIFLTAINKDEVHIFRGYEAGAVDYMFKPVEPGILRSKVAVFVDLYRKTEEVRRQAEQKHRLLAENLRVRTEKLEAERALRRSEERQALIVRALPIVLYTREVGNGFPFRYLTENAEAVLGVPAERFLDDAGFWESRLRPDDREHALAHLAAVPESGVSMIEYRWRRADGAYKVLLDHAVVLRDGMGPPMELCGTILDVTETREMQAQLAHAQKMEVVGQLTGGIAHDFNNMLMVVIGSLERLAGMFPGDEKVARRLDMALQASLRCADMTRRLLSFARRQQLHPKPVDLNELVVGMGELMDRTLSGSIDVVIEQGDGVWPAIVDPSQAESALMNLVINARDAMPEGGRLTIRTANVAAEEVDADLDRSPGDYVLLSVSDTGVGVPAELLERVFEPFFTTKDVGKGTGLGLSMVHGFVKQSGGVIKVDSEVGRGTTFRLYLPRAASPHVQPQGVAEPDGDTAGHGEVILVVDDEHDVRSVAVLTLQDLGYTVIEAETPGEALDILAGERPVDLLFTDVVMPGGVTGLELARESVKRRPTLRVLYTSGYADGVDDDGEAGELCSEILRKPYRRRELAEAVRQVLKAGTPSLSQS